MVVRDLCALPRLGQDLVQRVEREPDRADPHGRPVAPAVVRFAVAVPGPADEAPTVAGLRVRVEVFVVEVDVAAAMQQSFRDGDREDGVIGKPTVLDEQGEDFRPRAGSLVDRADDIARDRPKHWSILSRRTTRITGRRESMLISRPTSHRRSRACDGSSRFSDLCVNYFDSF